VWWAAATVCEKTKVVFMVPHCFVGSRVFRDSCLAPLSFHSNWTLCSRLHLIFFYHCGLRPTNHIALSPLPHQ
jgi:hypothetical protein